MASNADAMTTGEDRYRDVLDLLREEGMLAVFTQTGGGNAALEARLPDGRTLLVTDEEDSLSWNREEHRGWGVGIYREGTEYDDGPLAFESTDDGAPAALLPLVRAVIASTT
ncbi:hypothetical protein [Pseudokineococcus marinus]|uniref:Uncharacterized protein n=1 Tax=Pseudokineococcus marinus TaxID=351215 RepID=A0A849BFM4_9ACTN|nr:hypothetical protein [Pseudokineococcus marinus]NNH21869.1 hypothetical protein [Pseudokineococcus marinus]